MSEVAASAYFARSHPRFQALLEGHRDDVEH